MKKAKIFLALILMGILPLLLTCGGGGGGGGSTDGGGGGGGDGDTSEASATIGPSGGTVEVTNPSSPLYGVKVEIPAGALSNDTTISISVQKDEPSLPTYLKKVGTMVSLTPEGTFFNIPVTISIPYDSKSVTDINMLGVYTYNKETSSWNMLTLKDMGTGVIKVLTQHFSSVQVAEYTKPLSNQSDSGFKPSINGFSIKNFSDSNDEGHCRGMVSFAALYWEFKKSDKNLVEKYSSCEAEQVIKESHHKVKHTITTYEYLNQNDAYIANNIMIAIELKKPVILALFKKSSDPTAPDIGHAVLAYKYNKNSDSSITFYIYDPNYIYSQDDTTPIIYKNGKFESYDFFDKYTLIGLGYIYTIMSSFESIYNLEMMPKIENLLPTGTISSKRPTISATIKSPSPYNRDINTSNIEMKLDGGIVSHTVSGSGSVVDMSYTPDYDLSEGPHNVKVEAFDIEDISSCPQEWTFNIENVEGECTNIAGTWSNEVSLWSTCYRTTQYANLYIVPIYSTTVIFNMQETGISSGSGEWEYSDSVDCSSIKVHSTTMIEGNTILSLNPIQSFLNVTLDFDCNILGAWSIWGHMEGNLSGEGSIFKNEDNTWAKGCVEVSGTTEGIFCDDFWGYDYCGAAYCELHVHQYLKCISSTTSSKTP